MEIDLLQTINSDIEMDIINQGQDIGTRAIPSAQNCKFQNAIAVNQMPARALLQIAENPMTDPVTLSVLAFSSASLVREAVADNHNTPSSVLMLLAHDQDPDIRFQLAENHNLPDDILLELSQDENPYVRCRAEATLHRLH